MPARFEAGRTSRLVSTATLFVAGNLALGGSLKLHYEADHPHTTKPTVASAPIVAPLPCSSAAEATTPACQNHLPSLNPTVLLAKLCSLNSDESYAQCLNDIKNPPQVEIAAISPPVVITDANSVNTWDWQCIRKNEGTYNDYSGAYGILEGTWKYYLPEHGFNAANNYSNPGAAPPSVQDEAALFLYKQNHYQFLGTWNDPYTKYGKC